MEELKDRILKVELEMDIMKNDVVSVMQDTKEMAKELRLIQKNINQIKWFAMGALGLYTITTSGMTKLLPFLPL